MCRTYVRAAPVEAILRLAVREALRRLPPDAGLKGIPIFDDDARDAYGGVPGSDRSPLVSDSDLIDFVGSLDSQGESS